MLGIVEAAAGLGVLGIAEAAGLEVLGIAEAAVRDSGMKWLRIVLV